MRHCQRLRTSLRKEVDSWLCLRARCPGKLIHGPAQRRRKNNDNATQITQPCLTVSRALCGRNEQPFEDVVVASLSISCSYLGYGDNCSGKTNYERFTSSRTEVKSFINVCPLNRFMAEISRHGARENMLLTVVLPEESYKTWDLEFEGKQWKVGTNLKIYSILCYNS